MIPLLPLRLYFRPSATVTLPDYPGSVWRGALGARLRSDACITGAKTCEGCALRHRCAYGRVFEPVPTVGMAGLNKDYRDLPRPYVISPRHAGGRYGRDADLPVDLVLAGRAIGDVVPLRRAARRLNIQGRSMQLRDTRVLSSADGVETASIDEVEVRGAVPEPPPVPDRVRVVVEHPLRLRRDNRYLDAESLTAGFFVTTVIRRVSSLRDAVEAQPAPTDYAALAGQAESLRLERSRLRWFDWHRRSARQGKQVPMGGLIGEFELVGDLAPLWPWLWTGQWTHVGKGAVMGLGRYWLQRAA